MPFYESYSRIRDARCIFNNNNIEERRVLVLILYSFDVKLPRANISLSLYIFVLRLHRITSAKLFCIITSASTRVNFSPFIWVSKTSRIETASCINANELVDSISPELCRNLTLPSSCQKPFSPRKRNFIEMVKMPSFSDSVFIINDVKNFPEIAFKQRMFSFGLMRSRYNFT